MQLPWETTCHKPRDNSFFFTQKMKKSKPHRENAAQFTKEKGSRGSRKSGINGDIVSPDSLDKKAPPDISYEDAIKRFYRLRDIEKEKRIKEEARHSRETGGLL